MATAPGSRSGAPAPAATAGIDPGQANAREAGGWELWALGTLVAFLCTAGGGVALARRLPRIQTPQLRHVGAEPEVVEAELQPVVADEPDVVEPELQPIVADPDLVEAELQEIVAEGRARAGQERSGVDELVSVDD